MVHVKTKVRKQINHAYFLLSSIKQSNTVHEECSIKDTPKYRTVSVQSSALTRITTPRGAGVRSVQMKLTVTLKK